MAQTSVTLDAFAETVARAIEKYPEEKGRIERGACLVTTGHVEHVIADLWSVKSQRDDDTTYLVDRTGCPCVDQQRHPELACKHRWAITLLTIAEERARRQAVVDGIDATRVTLTKLIEQRAAAAQLVRASGNRPIEDPRCLMLDEQIARLRAKLPAVTLRTTVAA
jgi:hypothetical protein